MPLRWTQVLNLISLLVALFFVTSCDSMRDESIKNTESANIYLQLGVRYMDLNKLEIARDNLQLALKKDPQNSQVHNACGFLYEKLQDNQQAKFHYEQALKFSPDDWSVQNNFGRFLCDNHEIVQGLTLLKLASATSLNDKQWIALTNAGRCEIEREQKQSAQVYFEQALRLNASYAPALLEMQKVSFQTSDYLAAQTYFKRYMDVGSYTPASLWIAKQTEFALGNNTIARDYEEILLEKFPLSNEAKH